VNRRQFSLVVLLLLADIITDIVLGVYFSGRTVPTINAQILKALERERTTVDEQRRYIVDLETAVNLYESMNEMLKSKVKQDEDEISPPASLRANEIVSP